MLALSSRVALSFFDKVSLDLEKVGPGRCEFRHHHPISHRAPCDELAAANFTDCAHFPTKVIYSAAALLTSFGIIDEKFNDAMHKILASVRLQLENGDSYAQSIQEQAMQPRPDLLELTATWNTHTCISKRIQERANFIKGRICSMLLEAAQLITNCVEGTNETEPDVESANANLIRQQAKQLIRQRMQDLTSELNKNRSRIQTVKEE